MHVSEYTVRRLLRDAGYRRRQMLKYLDMGEHVDRNAQFENIARIKGEYLRSGNPIVSIDTKKRELLGTFYRDGKVYGRQALRYTAGRRYWRGTMTSPVTRRGS